MEDASGVQRLEAYFQRIGDVLGEDSRRGSFAIYAMGLMGDGERKSIVKPWEAQGPRTVTRENVTFPEGKAKGP